MTIHLYNDTVTNLLHGVRFLKEPGPVACDPKTFVFLDQLGLVTEWAGYSDRVDGPVGLPLPPNVFSFEYIEDSVYIPGPVAAIELLKDRCTIVKDIFKAEAVVAMDLELALTAILLGKKLVMSAHVCSELIKLAPAWILGTFQVVQGVDCWETFDKVMRVIKRDYSLIKATLADSQISGATVPAIYAAAGAKQTDHTVLLVTTETKVLLVQQNSIIMYTNPTVYAKLGNLLGTVVAAANNPKELLADRATILARNAVCSTCDKNISGTCMACGCILKIKASIAASKCPDSKW